LAEDDDKDSVQTRKSQHRQEHVVLGMKASDIATGQNEALHVVSRCGG